MDYQLYNIQRQFYQQQLNQYDKLNLSICKQITEQIVENVIEFYTYREPQYINSWYDQIDMLEKLAIRIITTTDIKIYHLRVHKQTVSNYCGFHASFNLIAVLQTLKWGWGLELLDGVSFWSYMLRTQNFLRDFATQTNQDKKAWPWRESDIQQGDFERTYWKICMNYNPIFYQTFKSETNRQNGMKLDLIVCTIYFQFGHLNNLMDEFTQLENQIKHFCQFKPSQNNSLIFAAMLGVTNHWVSLVAIKSIQGIKIFLLDSRVRDYLEWTETQMQDHINQANHDRIKSGLPQLTEFQQLISLQGMKDLKQCLFLITEWLNGKSTVDQFIANSFVKVFLDPLYNKMKVPNTDHFINLNIDYITSLPEYIIILENWAESYYHTISKITSKIYHSLNSTNIQAINKCKYILSNISYKSFSEKERIQSSRLMRIKEILENLSII